MRSHSETVITVMVRSLVAAGLLGTALSAYDPAAILTGYPSVYHIDRDGDGYGPAAPLGADADDRDPAVNTPATMLARYGTLETFLAQRGYHPLRIIFLSLAGSDTTGDGSAANPYHTWNKVKPLLRAGDMVIYRGGDYAPGVGSNPYRIEGNGLQGTADAPIVVMAYPGERVTLNASYSAMVLGSQSEPTRHVIVDGLDCFWAGEGVAGIEFYYTHHLTLRNIVIEGFARGVFAFQDLQDILIENVICRESWDLPNGTHGFYLGERDYPNSDITVRHCLAYRNGRHGFQMNGRCQRLVLEANQFHTNLLAGISFINGVRHGTIRDNLVFNNNRQGIVLYVYSEFGHQEPNTDNLFEHNTVWVGRHLGVGTGSPPRDYSAVTFNIDDGPGGSIPDPENYTMVNNVFRGNLLVSDNGATFRLAELAHGATTVVEENLLHKTIGIGDGSTPNDLVLSSTQTDGSHSVIAGSEYSWRFPVFATLTPLIQRNRYAAPLFADVQHSYATTPERFDFTLVDPEHPDTGVRLNAFGYVPRHPLTLALHTVSTDGGSVTLTISGPVGRYAVQTSTTLAGDWAEAGEVTIADSATPVAFSLPTEAAARRFFRAVGPTAPAQQD